MYITFGIFCLLLGLIFILLSIIKLIFTRSISYSSKLAGVLAGLGIILISIAIVLLHNSEDLGISATTIGIPFVLIGFLFIGIGSWHGIFAPIVLRNSKISTSLIILGLLFTIIGMMIISSYSTFFSSNHQLSQVDHKVFNNLFSYHIQSMDISAGLLLCILFIVGNVITLRNPSKINFIKANVAVILVTILIYIFDNYFQNM